MKEKETLFKNLINTFSLKHKPSQKEELIIDIIGEMCNHPETDIKVAPLTHRYFMVNKKLEYWIKVSDFETTITNHKFTLNYVGTTGFQDMLIKTISEAIEKARDEFEIAVFQNEIELLENIKQSFKFKK